MKRTDRWIVCQIGAREHYAIPRALHRAGRLAALITDFWCPPNSVLSRMSLSKRLRDRWHPELASASVFAANFRMLSFEARARLLGLTGWPLIVARNRFFQKQAIRLIRSLRKKGETISCLFSYSYAAEKLFRYASQQGLATVLGQIDPGPEEERIVGLEHQRYPNLGSRWQPAPVSYWASWRDEIELSDRIVVNSDWSLECLTKAGIDPAKLVEIPLVYERRQLAAPVRTTIRRDEAQPTINDGKRLQILFLGQINLRKGVGRLLDAMRLLKNEPIDLTLAGPTEIDPSSWSDLPNVKWIGPIARSDVGSVYQAADLFILPTLSDGYAITQLEAVAYDLPVMRSTRCGNPFDSNNEMMLLCSLEPADISAALLRVCTAARIQVNHCEERRFTMDDLAQSLMNVVEKSLPLHA